MVRKNTFSTGIAVIKFCQNYAKFVHVICPGHWRHITVLSALNRQTFVVWISASNSRQFEKFLSLIMLVSTTTCSNFLPSPSEAMTTAQTLSGTLLGHTSSVVVGGTVVVVVDGVCVTVHVRQHLSYRLQEKFINVVTEFSNCLRLQLNDITLNLKQIDVFHRFWIVQVHRSQSDLHSSETTRWCYEEGSQASSKIKDHFHFIITCSWHFT